MYCEKCGLKLVKIYNVEEIERQFKAEGIKKYTAMQAQFNLLRNVKCPDPSCGFAKELSPLEIMMSFAQQRKEEGKSAHEIVEEARKKVKEIMKDEKD